MGFQNGWLARWPVPARVLTACAVVAPSAALATMTLPAWTNAVLVGLQAGLVWTAVRAPLTRAAAGGGQAPFLDRAAVQAALVQPGNGARGAALAVRIDDAQRLRALHGDAAFALLSQDLGDRLGRALRDQDVFCAIGDDGFGIALFPQRGLDLGGVLAIAQRLQARLAQPVRGDHLTIWPSVSIGFSISARAAALNGLDMLQAAEIAADKALRSGPGGLSSYSVVDFPATLSAGHLGALRRALTNGEIRAYFQPQIRTDTGAVSGFEALARWQHPDRGLIAPGEFLPQIEAAGLSPLLAERMLRDSLDLLVALDRAGHTVPSVSVNLSAEELRNPRLADEIGWELERHDLPPERLSLEILETVIAEGDDDIAVRTIARLAAMGCGIDLDDFGTGHASIAHIRRFAVGRIKIDRSFVTNLHRDHGQRRMVAAILSMAEQLGIATLAEGVESAGEQVLLAQMGCDHLQGFAIARPMPAQDLPTWLRAHAEALARGEPWCEDAETARTADGTDG